MIVTITMNAAIDKMYAVERNEPGEVLRVRECVATPGGKGLNVARVIAAMGERSLATGLLGGHSGRWVQEALTSQGIAHDFEHVPGETRTCINIVEPNGRQTEFLEPGFEVGEAELAAFERRLERLMGECDIATISGSVPRGVPVDCYACIVAMARRMGKPVLLDSSGALLKSGVEALPTLIKPNTDEIAQLLGHKVTADGALEAARALHGRGIAYVVISMGKLGSLMVCDAGAFKATPPHIEAVSATGCGDSMIAGLAISLLRGYAPEEMLRYATAVSAANALEKGTGCVVRSKAEALLGEVCIARLD